jgi:hypothetical protein
MSGIPESCILDVGLIRRADLVLVRIDRNPILEPAVRSAADLQRICIGRVQIQFILIVIVRPVGVTVPVQIFRIGEPADLARAVLFRLIDETEIGRTVKRNYHRPDRTKGPSPGASLCSNR